MRLFFIIFIVVTITEAMSQVGNSAAADSSQYLPEENKFAHLICKLPCELTFTGGRPQALKVQANDYILKNIEFGVRAGVLKLKLKGGLFRFLHRKWLNDEVLVFISNPSLSTIEMTGPGVINVFNIKADNISCKINGNGTLQLKSQSRQLTAIVNGSGKIKLIGTTQKSSLHIEGTGIIDATEFLADTIHSAISGTGQIITKPAEWMDLRTQQGGHLILKSNDFPLPALINGQGIITREKEEER
ncbi:MAG: hypothetical protein A3H98_06745 [Bacteroidetes bacterium RIFCSPLOWO2_02_FULL_36_8]|nr:MAG: hypothetical protein A3H98_06745 [Bacteroidetes bacterium RIFCSPLOWO2_02_FULL_36_8]OFY71161.1 MAG: hypothetical protein A3G23_15255 [Bacteroidetes bacterium RIFCSPLOWO2_12_FULL_37_12]